MSKNKNVKIYEHAQIIGLENIEFGHDIIIDDFVFIHAKNKISIGNYVHVACHTSLTGGEVIEIADFCAISQGCRVLTGTDDFTDWGFGNSTIEERYRNTKRAPIRINKFSIIGANSVILPGVTIGEGAAIGACSVVTKDLDPWGVYIGNKRVKERNKEGILKNYNTFLLNENNGKKV